MRVLVGKTFGLGNCVMSIPMLKALRSLESVEQLDVLIGSTPDDGGAFDVFKHLVESGTIDHIYINTTPPSNTYDVAIMAIPFDGRWRNKFHFHAERVLDGRTRPDPSTTGLISWKKHEVEYQMENAYELGYRGPIPNMSFYPSKGNSYPRDIYLGVGYKKDESSFWSVKHWGNENFVKFANVILNSYDNSLIRSTGDTLDWKLSLEPIKQRINNLRFIPDITNLDEAFSILNACGIYVGNDTGMMHVAASMGIPCISVFNLANSYIKNRPWGDDHLTIDGTVIDDTLSVVIDEVRYRINERS